MPTLPSPLHPAIVHFPIVLIMLGAGVALAAVFSPRWPLRLAAGVLLVLGALGALAASATGEEDGEAVAETPAVEALLDEHETWAKRTQLAAGIGAVLVLASAVVSRNPGVARGLSAAGAVGAFLACWCVYETGHRGGQLVYRHGAGINLAPTAASSGPTATSRASREDHDD